MTKKYLVNIEMSICIDDVTRILNYAEQGWRCECINEFHSDMLICNRTVEVECNEATFPYYIKALSNMLPSDARIVWHDEA
jgi:hypothetical protein